MTQWAINAYAFVFNDTATTEIYTLSLHDALPISAAGNAPVFAVEVWPYLTSLPICLYTPSDACPRMTEAVVRRLTPRIPPGPPRATDPEAADLTAAPPAVPFHAPLATCS